MSSNNHPAPYGPTPPGRTERRYKERKTKELGLHCSRLVDAYFKYADQRHTNEELFLKLMELIAKWKAWLRKNFKVYNYEENKNVLYDRIKDLMSLEVKFGPHKVQQLVKSGDE